jgi:hypothetical protein
MNKFMIEKHIKHLKMKKLLILTILAGINMSAQVKIGDNTTSINDSSLLELESVNKGVLFPRVSLTNSTSYSPLAGTQVMGMTVYNTATTGDVSPGLYTNNGIVWVKNEGVVVRTIPTWRDDFNPNPTLSATDGNNFVRLAANQETITLPTATPEMVGKVFTVISGSSGVEIIAGAVGIYWSSVTNIAIKATIQMVTNGTDWFSLQTL